MSIMVISERVFYQYIFDQDKGIVDGNGGMHTYLELLSNTIYIDDSKMITRDQLYLVLSGLLDRSATPYYRSYSLDPASEILGDTYVTPLARLSFIKFRPLLDIIVSDPALVVRPFIGAIRFVLIVTRGDANWGMHTALPQDDINNASIVNTGDFTNSMSTQEIIITMTSLGIDFLKCMKAIAHLALGYKHPTIAATGT